MPCIVAEVAVAAAAFLSSVACAVAFCCFNHLAGDSYDGALCWLLLLSLGG